MDMWTYAYTGRQFELADNNRDLVRAADVSQAQLECIRGQNQTGSDLWWAMKVYSKGKTATVQVLILCRIPIIIIEAGSYAK